jgi:hypothetical protein
MLCQLTAILVQTVRSAVRSRLVLSVLGLLLFACAVLPLSIRADGTALNEMRIALSYTLSAAALLLSIVTLWASSGAVAHEVENRQIRLLAVKPVNWYVVWLGKWLGVVVLDAAFLGIVAVVLFCHVQRILHRDDVTAADRHAVRAEVLTARTQIDPQDAQIDGAELHRRVDGLAQSGIVPADMRHHEVINLVEKQMRAELARVPPGINRSWTFALAEGEASRPPYVLQYRLAPTAFNPGTLPGHWEVQTTPDAAAVYLAASATRGGSAMLHIPPEVLSDAHYMVVTYVNPAMPEGRTVIFQRDDALILLAGEGSFVMNLLRAMLVVLGALATLAAIGITAGAILSFPVASLTALSLLILFAAGRFVTFSATQPAGHSHTHDGKPCEAMHKFSIGEPVLKAMSALVSPAVGIQPAGTLARGVRIHWRETASAVALLGVFYPAILGIFGAWRLGKRELAAA